MVRDVPRHDSMFPYELEHESGTKQISVGILELGKVRMQCTSIFNRGFCIIPHFLLHVPIWLGEKLFAHGSKISDQTCQPE